MLPGPVLTNAVGAVVVETGVDGVVVVVVGGVTVGGVVELKVTFWTQLADVAVLSWPLTLKWAVAVIV